MNVGNFKKEEAFKILKRIFDEDKTLNDEERKYIEELPFKPEVEIFPFRLPSDETVAKFLSKIQKMKGITQITLCGPRTYYEKKINVAGKIIPLRVQVSKFWVELEEFSEVKKLKEICKETFPYGFNVKIGRFSVYHEIDKARKTFPIIRVDYLKSLE